MDDLYWVAATLMAANFIALIFLALKSARNKHWITSLTVYEWSIAALYRHGRFVRLLQPGTYRFWGRGYWWWQTSTMPDYLLLRGQDVVTRDLMTITASFVVRFQVVDAKKLVAAGVHGDSKLVDTLRVRAQPPSRTVMAQMTLQQIFGDRSGVTKAFQKALTPVFAELGIEVLEVQLRDLAMNYELRVACAAVEVARRNGEALLTRARGEVAAMRALANAARMARDNPELMQLRVLQGMQGRESARHSLMVDFGVKRSGAAATTPGDQTIQ